jgi:ketosteroid isomerase-like protein
MDHVRRTALAILIACAAWGGAAHAQGVIDLLTMSPTWEALYNAADVDGLVGLYAEDAVIMPPDAPAATGAAAMRANVEAYLGAGLVRSEVPAVEAYEVSGDLAWGAGPYRFYDAYGNLAAEGKYLVVYGFADGVWRIVRHMWSNDAPPPAPEG